MKKLAFGIKSISASDGFSLPGHACHRQEVKHRGKKGNEVSKYCIQDEGGGKKKKASAKFAWSSWSTRCRQTEKHIGKRLEDKNEE